MCGVIRRAAAQDIDAILSLIDANTDRLVARDPDEVRQLIESFWVAEEDGQIVGCCCLEIYSPKIAELRSLAVRDGYRRRGIGARLTAAAVDEANRRGIPQVLVVTSNRDFFERLNFGSCLNEKYALFWNAPETAGE